MVLLLARRGLGHAGELWLFTQVFSSSNAYWANLNHQIETNLIGFVLIVVAMNALYELLQLAIRPDLRAACNDDSPMLDWEKDR